MTQPSQPIEESTDTKVDTDNSNPTENVPTPTEPAPTELPTEPPHIHDYQTNKVDATCEADGYTTYTCECGDTYMGDNVSALGHDYKQVITVATCVSDGYTTNTCTRCGSSYDSDHTQAFGHNYSSQIQDPTCLNDGYTYHQCSYCDASYTSDYIDAYGHSWGDWSTIRSATIFECGQKIRTCSTCGKEDHKSTDQAYTGSITLKSPENPSSYMVAPTQEDFGENYDKAVQLYEAIINNDELLNLYFGGNAEYEKGRGEYREFADLFEQKVLCGRMKIISPTFATGAFPGVGSGLVRIKIHPSETYSVAQSCYDINIEAGLYDGMSKLDAVTNINRWLVDNLSYELGHSEVYDVITTRKAQCAGYATLFYHLCENVGIDALYVVGCASSSQHGSTCWGCHAWNRVELGGSWYYIDTCWNDSGSTNRYFLTCDLWYDRHVNSESSTTW
jgi:transglutaminase/protease-like cytokinesis protein 3